MRELTTPSLFNESDVLPPVVNNEASVHEEKRTEKLAKDFIRWCFGFGPEFRNSPDIINLRTWANKLKWKLTESEEIELLQDARKLYLRRIDQMMKKSESPMFGGPQASENPA
jgi:hypothetical protein